MTVKISISKIDLKGTFQEKMLFHDPIEMVIFSFFSIKTQLHLVLCDIVHMRFSKVDEIRKIVSKQLGISDKEIILHFTHDHTGPSDWDTDLNLLSDKIIEGVEKNRCHPLEVKMAHMSVDTNGEFNVNRRKLMPKGLGKFTVWTGVEAKNGKHDGSKIAIHRLKGWFGEDFELEELKKPLLYDDSDRDTLLQAVMFCDSDNNLVGSLIRFSAHPSIANHSPNKKYSADFPGAIRRIMKEKFGGEHGFLTGPCGNIIAREKVDWPPLKPNDSIICMVPGNKMKDEDTCHAEVQRFATEIVQKIEFHFPKESEFVALTELKNQFIDFKFDLRDDLLPNVDMAKQEFSKVIEDLKINRNNYPLSEVKRLIDLAHFLDYHEPFYELGFITEDDYRNGFIMINIPSFKINDLILQGMPGESFWELGASAKNWANENNIPLMTFSFANGSILYLPSDEERPYGDYEANLCIGKLGITSKLAYAILTSSQKIH